MGIKSSQQKGLTGLDESLFKNQGRKSIGGTITYSNGYIIHTFTGSGQLTVLDSSLNVEYLLVAGGGAGGGYHGGGGGAGGKGGDAPRGKSNFNKGGKPDARKRK